MVISIINKVCFDKLRGFNEPDQCIRQIYYNTRLDRIGRYNNNNINEYKNNSSFFAFGNFIEPSINRYLLIS